MRTYGRSAGRSVKIVTDPNGQNDQIYLTTMIQVLKLNLGESPFYANYGIPAQQNVMQQIFPDYYVSLVQQQFAQYFVLADMRTSTTPPTYLVNVITHNGIQLDTQIQVPQ